MLEARIRFSLDGTLISNDYPNLIVGDNDTTKIKISFENEAGELLDLRNYAIECVVIRPDGEKSPSLTLVLDYQDYRIAIIKIGNWMTEISGTDIFTFRLRDTRLRNENNLKATGIANLVIGNGSNPADVVITEPQLKALQDAIADLNANKVNRTTNGKVVYATKEEPNEDGTYDDTTIPYSVTPLANSVVVRGKEGRAEFEDPEGEKDAVNKRTYDKVVRATTLNHAGLLFVSPLNETTGKVTVIFNSSLVRHISDVNPETGTIRITARPINWDCTPRPQEGGNN